MRICINAPKGDGEGRFRLYLPIPLWMARFSFIWKHLPEPSRQYAAIAPELVKALRQYKRENGSWNLVEVHTADGEANVVIRV